MCCVWRELSRWTVCAWRGAEKEFNRALAGTATLEGSGRKLTKQGVKHTGKESGACGKVNGRF